MGDGYADLLYTHYEGTRQEALFINQGDGTFKEEAEKRGVDAPEGSSHGQLLVDIDCDGDFDIWNGATRLSHSHLYRNDGRGFFTDISEEAGIITEWFATTRGVTAGDINGDGLPDLVAVNPSWSNEIYINRDGIHFTSLGDVAARGFGVNNEYPDLGLYEIGALLDLGIPEERDHAGLKQGISLVDYDGDGDMDLISCIWDYPLHLIANDGKGRFTLLDSKKLLGGYFRDFTGSAFYDLDNDGLLDCVLGSEKVTAVFKNKGDGTFKEMTPKSLRHKSPSEHSYHVAAGDVDNDGLIDLYITRCYRPNLLYRNLGNFRFKLMDEAKACLDSVTASKADCRSACFVDYDNDGDLDIWVAYKKHRGQLLRNELKSENYWLNVELIGPRGDAGAFGSQVWIYEAGHIDNPRYLIGYQQAQGAYGYMGQNDPVLHFGLGKRDVVDLKLRFLDGSELLRTGIEADQRVLMSDKN